LTPIRIWFVFNVVSKLNLVLELFCFSKLKGVPETIKPEDFDDVHEMYNKLSIENWILPAAFMRVIDTIVWICPPW